MPETETESPEVVLESSPTETTTSGFESEPEISLGRTGEIDWSAFRNALADAEVKVGQVACQRTAKNNKDNNNNKQTYVPPKQLLLYLVRMGSFTSMPKVSPAPDADDTDVDYGREREDLETFLNRCAAQLGSLPPPISRKWRKVISSQVYNGEQDGRLQLTSFDDISTASTAESRLLTSRSGSEKIRVLQWNVLSQALGKSNDNFVKCPAKALDWRTRRFRMLEEIARHDADVICLQEVDHFRFLKKSLAALGYAGHFTPKPDSPCLYLANNAGPDGCAIFYKKDKFDLCKLDSRVIEVWRVQSNQVVLSMTLRSKESGNEVVFATTHLKARNGALMPTLRNEQGKDLLEYVVSHANGRPVVVTGDFNAQPDEPVYQTMTTSNELRLTSAYSDINRMEADYTTWKIREDGEHKETLDYVFLSSNRGLAVDSVLEMPTGQQIGPDRLPSLAYASDHFSLVADIKLSPPSKKV